MIAAPNTLILRGNGGSSALRSAAGVGRPSLPRAGTRKTGLRGM